MALGNQQPLRPFVQIEPITIDGRYPKGWEQVYVVPYNYIKRFSIDYKTNAIGDVELELFDPNYDDLINLILRLIEMQSGDMNISFLLHFGWSDTYQDTISNRDMNIADGQRYYETTQSLTVETGEKDWLGNQKTDTVSRKVNKAYNIDPNLKNLTSEKFVVQFRDISFDVLNMGVFLKMKGQNMQEGGLSLLLQLDAVYKGSQVDIIDTVCKNNDINVRWDVNKDKVQTFPYEINAVGGNNFLMGDFVKSMLDECIYNGLPNTLKFYIDNTYTKTKDIYIPTIVIYSEGDRNTNKIYVGKYSYFIGKESSIIGNLSFEFEDMLGFFGGKLSSKTQDTSTKQTEGDETKNVTLEGYVPKVDSNNNLINRDARQRKADKKKAFKLSKVEGAMARIAQARFPGGAPDAKTDTEIRNSYENYMMSFPFKVKLSIMGEANLNFKHIGLQGTLELNVFKNNGEKIKMLSGMYSIDTIHHEISDVNFITTLELIKYPYDMEEGMQPSKGEDGSSESKGR